MHIGIKTAVVAIASVALMTAPAFANEESHEGHTMPAEHAGHGDAGHGDMNHGDMGHEATAEEGHDAHGGGHHDAGFAAEIGVGVANGYERFGAIVTDETVTKGFAGVSYSFGNGFHAGVHGLVASTAKEQFELEVGPHVGYHGDGFVVSAAYNSVNHTNHDLTTTEAEIGVGYQVAEHTALMATANVELDHEKRKFYEAGFDYARPLNDEFCLRFKARAGYLSTDGIVSSHDAGHTTEETTPDTGHDTPTDTGHFSSANTAETTDTGHETTTNGTTGGGSFAGLHRGSAEIALDYLPGSLHGLTVTGFARSIFPLSDDGRKDMEARSFDGKTNAIMLVGAEVSFGF